MLWAWFLESSHVVYLYIQYWPRGAGLRSGLTSPAFCLQSCWMLNAGVCRALPRQLDFLPWLSPLHQPASNNCDGNCCVILRVGNGVEKEKRGWVESLLFLISLLRPEAPAQVWRSGCCRRKLHRWEYVSDCLLPCQHPLSVTTATRLQLSHPHTHTHWPVTHRQRRVSVVTSVYVSVHN